MLRQDFSPNHPFTQVPTEWFNDVAKFINGLTGGLGINVQKSGGQGQSALIEVDVENLNKFLNIPSYATKGQGATDDTKLADFTDATEDDRIEQYEGEWHWSPESDSSKTGVGLVLDVYSTCYEEEGWHYLGRTRLTFSKGGLLLSAVKIPGSKEIEA